MVATRRSQRSARDEEDEAHKSVPVHQYDDPMSDSDDEAPEEVTLASGKETAAQQRRIEQEARKQVASVAKDRKRRLSSQPAKVVEEEEAEGVAEDQGEEEEEYYDGEDLDLLPDTVIEAIAQGTDRRPLERRIVSEQLRAGLQQQIKKIKKERKSERRVGAVTVKVLKGTEDRRASEAAKAFLQQRLHGGVKRSNDMLRPTTIGGVFAYGPAKQ